MSDAKNNERRVADVKFNDKGRRIGDSHPRAVLTDHEVGLLSEMLDEREELIAALLEGGSAQSEIDRMLTARGLSYRCLAVVFEVHKQTIAKVAQGVRRCQTPA